MQGDEPWLGEDATPGCAHAPESEEGLHGESGQDVRHNFAVGIAARHSSFVRSVPSVASSSSTSSPAPHFLKP